jgi:murein DD-endopeptidase MepM/ murein hydrolase activator NlpD
VRLWLLLLLASPLAAVPQFHVPGAFRPGSVNEVYAWDDGPLPSFSVEVRRPEGGLVASARSFAVDKPLPAGGWHWSAALVALDALDAPGPVKVRVLDGKTVLWEGSSSVEPVTFVSEDIPLDEAMSDLRAVPDPRKEREAARIWAIYQTFHADFVPESVYRLPVPATTRRSAGFGDQRRFLYSDGGTARDYHRGIDFAVPVGTSVMATARGRVALVADRELTGITVVLEHAPGVYSVYFHLSKALVEAGQTVEAGSVIALSGATGLVTGPHLHWEFRVDGISVDPMPLVARGLLDTNTVSGVVSSELNR